MGLLSRLARATLGSCALLVAVPLCVAGGRGRAVEYLDERTGATLTVVMRPLIFAQRQSVLAANSRDYLALTAAEIDRSGEQALYFVGYVWSTIDRRGPARDHRLPRRRVVLIADARPIILLPEADYPPDLADDRRLSSPGRKYQERLAFRVNLEQLRYIAQSTSLAVRLQPLGEGEDSAEPGDEDEDLYQLWQDGRQSLAALVRLIGPG